MSILAYINAPVTLILLVCLLLKSLSFFKLVLYFLKYYFTVMICSLFLIMFIDFGFFSYFRDHYNIAIFGIFEDDTVALIKTIMADYRFYAALVIFAVLCVIIYKISNWTYRELRFNERIINTLYWKNITKILIVLVIITLNFLVARGSLSMFPLGLFYSQISPDYFINKLCVNPVHPLADTIYLKITSSANKMNLKDVYGYDNDNAVINDLQGINIKKDAITIQSAFLKKTPANKSAERIRPNVILIVLEGFGEIPVLQNSKDFNVMGELKEHFDQDTVFYNFLPAGFITIHAIESIILNIPQRPLVNQITQTSDALKKFLNSAVHPYKKAGYRSIAIYGGSMTWRDLEGFFKVQGFDETVGEGNVIADVKDRHEWGINDSQFFQLVEQYLKNKSGDKPKFIFAMSTGTHPPYKMPDGYEPLPLEIPNQIRNMMSAKDFNNKSIFPLYQYANRELAKFLSMVKNSDFAKNTIIAVTGDHNLRELSNHSQENMFLRYAVPFYLYIPEELKKENINVLLAGSHMDIMPTLYGLSLSETDYVSMGNDLINTNDNISFNIDGLIVRGSIAVQYNYDNDSFVSFNFDKITKKLSVTEASDEHKNLVRYYKSAMTAADILVKS